MSNSMVVMNLNAEKSFAFRLAMIALLPVGLPAALFIAQVLPARTASLMGLLILLGLACGVVLGRRSPQPSDADGATQTTAAEPLGLSPAKPPDDQLLLSQIIDSLEGGVMTINSDGTVTSFNPVAQETLGHEARHVVGQHYNAAFPAISENRDLRAMIAAAIRGHQTFSSEEVRVARADGTLVPLGVTLSQLRDPAGQTRGTVLMFKDLAKLMSLREHVKRTDQLASLGRLAAGMAHEIRNPLGALHGLAELIQEDLADADPRRRYTGTILRTVDHLNELVENLLEFSHPPMTHVRPQVLSDIVREGIQLCCFEGSDGRVAINEVYPPDPVTVRADRETLCRAIINVLHNAIQATPDGGLVTVSVHPVEDDGEGPERIAVDIHNTGSYIQPGDREQVFTPFFTTKPTGTGLGLPIAHQIVSAHGGRIDIASEPESGTRFSLVLPVAAAPAPMAVATLEAV
jgi:two-component system, NtrC family, sensor histidine kinase AtoS